MMGKELSGEFDFDTGDPESRKRFVDATCQLISECAAFCGDIDASIDITDEALVLRMVFVNPRLTDHINEMVEGF